MKGESGEEGGGKGGGRGGRRGEGETRKHGTHTEAEKEDNQRGLRGAELLSLFPPSLPLSPSDTLPTGVLLYC